MIGIGIFLAALLPILILGALIIDLLMANAPRLARYWYRGRDVTSGARRGARQEEETVTSPLSALAAGLPAAVVPEKAASIDLERARAMIEAETWATDLREPGEAER